MICTKCKKMVNANCGKIIDNKFYCEHCLDKYKRFLSLCYECKEPIFTETAHKTTDNHYVCEICAAEYCDTCPECGGWFHEDNLIFIKDKHIDFCLDCTEHKAKQCSFCLDFFSLEHLTQISNNIWVCNACKRKQLKE